MKGEHEEINDENVSWTKDNNSSNFVYLSSSEREREMYYTWQMVIHTRWRTVLPEQYCILVRCGDFVSARIICHIKLILRIWWEFLGSPVVRTLTFHLRGHEFDLGLGNPTSHMTCIPTPQKNRDFFCLYLLIPFHFNMIVVQVIMQWDFHLVFSLYYDGDNLRNHWIVLGIIFDSRGFYSLFTFSRHSTILSEVPFSSSLFQGFSKWDPGSPEGCHAKYKTPQLWG